MDAEERDTSCGLFDWRPKWLQRFASLKLYIVLYSILNIVQTMGYSYANVVLSNVEKRFGIRSKELAWIYSGNEIAQGAFIVFTPFLHRVSRRPLFMSLAVTFSAIGFFIQASPYFINRAKAWKYNETAADIAHVVVPFCGLNNDGDKTTCNVHDVEMAEKDVTSLALMFTGNFVVGFGTNFLYAFGYPYGDDNINKGHSPFMIGLLWASRLLGPALGYLLGAACLKFYINPLEDIDFEEGDPRWIGAWWLGYPMIGVVLLFFTPWIMLYPRRLRRDDTDAAAMAKAKLNRIKDESKTPIQNIVENFHLWQRLVRNKAYFFNVWSLVFATFAVIGYAQFMPKYLEVYYRQKASKSGYLGGLTQTFAAVTGTVLTGFIVTKLKPGARLIAGYNVLCGALVCGLYFSLAFLDCPKPQLNSYDTSLCLGENCQCSEKAFYPICDAEFGTLYYK